MKPETRKRFSPIVDEVKEHEGFQKAAKIGRRHQAGDGSVSLSPGSPVDTGIRALRGAGRDLGTNSGFVLGLYLSHRLASLSSVVKRCGRPSARLSTTASHRSSSGLE